MLPRAILFDLDNTLAASKQAITPVLAEALTRLLARTRVAVISGGGREQLTRQVAAQLPEDAALEHLYLMPTSGAALYAYEDGTWRPVYEERLEEAEVAEITQALEEAARSTGLVDLAHELYGPYIENRGAQVSLSALGQQAPLPEKEAWDPTREKREALVAAIVPLLPGFDVKIGGTTTIDVTKKGVNKAFGVRRLAEHLSLPVSDMLYVGDELMPGGNDEVVRETGIPALAVANPNETQALIDRLVGTEAGQQPRYTARMLNLKDALRPIVRGDLYDDPKTLDQMSRDTSVFVRHPKLVVYPKDAQDTAALVGAVAKLKEAGEDVSITARSAGTDMSGGPLGTSIIAVFTKYLNRLREIRETDEGGYAVVEPGMYYRDFEKETLAHGGLMLQSYPASRELAAIGGLVNNNSGGERTLEYGKTEEYVEELEVVLADGSLTTFAALSPEELEAKKALPTLEGRIYREMDELLTTHAQAIKNAKPKVSKNSAGYALWSVKDEMKGTFNLAKLVTGAQGTLALTTAAKLRLVKDQGNRSMLVAFLKKRDLPNLPHIVHAVLPHNPESFESFDEHTLSLAIRFLPSLLRQMGLGRAIRLGFSFLPEAWQVLLGGAPALILMAEFSEDAHEDALAAARAAQASLAPFNLPTRVLADERASEKYWIVRRESFALLRKHSKGLYAAPFIDDLVVPPEAYPQFLPELNALLAEYQQHFIYTIAGHIGNGNFHIIPLMDLRRPEVRDVIVELSPRVYALVKKYGGSTTGEHNDGIIRTPYLEEFFGPEVNGLFKRTKEIFDPHNIFNPGKKVGGTFKDIRESMITSTA